MKVADTVEDHIRSNPESTQKILIKLQSIIRKLIPDAEETIRYGIPTYRLNENLVHFAGYEHHIGFYPTPEVIKAFTKKLTNYKTSKGAIQFPLDKGIPYDLITEMIKYRMKHLKAPKGKTKTKSTLKTKKK